MKGDRGVSKKKGGGASQSERHPSQPARTAIVEGSQPGWQRDARSVYGASALPERAFLEHT